MIINNKKICVEVEGNLNDMNLKGVGWRWREIRSRAISKMLIYYCIAKHYFII